MPFYILFIFLLATCSLFIEVLYNLLFSRANTFDQRLHNERLRVRHLSEEQIRKEAIIDSIALQEAMNKPKEEQSEMIKFYMKMCEKFGMP